MKTLRTESKTDFSEMRVSRQSDVTRDKRYPTRQELYPESPIRNNGQAEVGDSKCLGGRLSPEAYRARGGQKGRQSKHAASHLCQRGNESIRS
jgi:hypothetical protein